jgi:colicin V production protein
VVVLGFAVRGFLRGTVAQVFLVLGLLGGLWAAGWTSHWLGEHWRDARPTPLFVILRWVVAGLAGMALASVFQWWGERLGQAVKTSPFGWLDRTLGLAMGVVVSGVVLAFVVMAALVMRHPAGVAESVARTRLAAPLMHGAASVCGIGNRYFPGSAWLRQRFRTAERRTRNSRSVEHDGTRS